MITDMAARDKGALRRCLLTARGMLSAEQRARHAAAIRRSLQALPELRTAGGIFCYVSYAEEVPTRQLLEGWLAEGKIVCVPRIQGEHRSTRMLARRIRSLGELRPDRRGIPQPAPGPEFAGTLDLSITPGLGFSTVGTRLGYGRGYYDRWFARHPDCLRVALAFEAQLCETVPAERHDLPMHCIVTEQRLIRTGAAADSA